MPLRKNNGGQIHVNTTPELHARIKYHCERTGKDMNDLLRDAAMNHMDLLDEKEALMLETRRMRKTVGAFVPSVVAHPFDKPRGLKGKRSTMSKVTTEERAPGAEIILLKIAKLRPSFPRWASYIEDAADRADGERRADIVIRDIRERCASEMEAIGCYEALADFMKGRADARRLPLNVVEIDTVDKVSGDVEK